MPTNLYINNYGSIQEQRLIEDLLVESIKFYGFDGYYIPMDNTVARDLLYGEDPLKKFTAAYPLEFYMSNTNDYMGEQDFFSKFGLEIRNNVSLMFSKRSFSERIPQESNLPRPNEGDLIYIPMVGSSGQGALFEIKLVNSHKDFFTLGRKYPFFYQVELEEFKYSHEIISTGQGIIDQIAAEEAYAIELYMGSGSGSYTFGEIVYQSADGTLANATAQAIQSEWNQVSKILKVTNIQNQMKANTIVIGKSSNARYTLVTFDPLHNSQTQESFDNQFIQNEASGYVDFSETNPFGNL
jgi:Virus neck protein